MNRIYAVELRPAWSLISLGSQIFDTDFPEVAGLPVISTLHLLSF